MKFYFAGPFRHKALSQHGPQVDERSSRKSQRQFFRYGRHYAKMVVCPCGGDTSSRGDLILIDESLEQIVPESIMPEGIVGISVHTEMLYADMRSAGWRAGAVRVWHSRYAVSRGGLGTR